MPAESDEDAIQNAIDTLYGECGNNGQTAIIDEISGDFEDFAWTALEADEGSNEPGLIDLYGAFMEWTGGRQDKWDAVWIIMANAWSHVQDMYGFHDGGDESGEGTGS